MDKKTILRQLSRQLASGVCLLALIASAAGHAAAGDEAQDAAPALTPSPPMPRAHQLQLMRQAQVSAEAEDWPRVLAAIEAIPANQRDADNQALWQQAMVHTAITRARGLPAQNRRQAWQELWEAEAHVGTDPDLIGALAFAYLDAEAPAAGMALIHEHLQGGVSSNSSLHLHYAGLLFRIGDDNGFLALMDRLGNVPLTEGEQAHYDELLRLREIHAVELSLDEGRLDEAEARLAAALAQHPDDAWGRDVLARLRVAQGRAPEALALYQGLVRDDPDNLDLLRGAAWTAVQTGDRAAARDFSARAVARAPEDAAVLLDAARVERTVGRQFRAARLYQRSLAAQGHSGNGSTAQWRTTSDELASLRNPRGVQLAAGVLPRLRRDQPGLSRLMAIELPVELQLPLPAGWLSLSVTPVRLDAGDFDSRPYIASVFGGGPVLALDAEGSQLISPHGGSRYSRYARGVGYAAAYHIGGFSADLGVSPDGFMTRHVVGGLRYERTLGARQALWYAVSAERRSVTDSVLSWGGVFDPRGGGVWGGVTRTGGLVRLRYDHGAIRLDGHAGYDRFEGEQVRDNHRLRAGAGASRSLLQDEQQTLRVGVAASWESYDHNQHYFTWGHGGYFSPQQAWWLGVPIEWAWRNARLSYRVDAALGVQAIHQDAVAYFPLDPDMQRQASSAMNSIIGRVAGFGGVPVYAEQNDHGIAYHLGAALEYRLSGHWTLGGGLRVDNHDDYSQWGGALYLRYFLSPGAGHLALPITPLSSPYVR